MAGLLAPLSPCILPVAPIILVSAWQANRFGPLVLVLGLSFSFTLLGLVFAATGNFVGLSPQGLRHSLSLLLIILGGFLFWPFLEHLWMKFFSPLVQKFHSLSVHPSLSGLPGQFFLGMLLGGTWFPCMGPTLALAITLASQRQNLFEAGTIMLLYCLGAGLPLIAISYLSQRFSHKKIGTFSSFGKKMLGLVMIGTGLLLLTNTVETLETWIAMHSPSWLMNITTRY